MPRHIHPKGAPIRVASFQAPVELLERLDAAAARESREKGEYVSRSDMVRHFCDQGSKGAFVDATVASVKKE